MPTTPQGFQIRTDLLKAELVEQSRRVQSIIEAAFEAVFDRNLARVDEVNAKDDEIDRADVALERAAVALLADATSAGASLDEAHLRLVLTIVKINNDLERAADAAVDVAALVQNLKNLREPFPDTFRMMANSVIGIVRDASAAFHRADPALAKVTLQSQHAVTEFKNAIIRDAEDQIARGKMHVDFAFHLHEIASLAELIADHCTNICEQVIYQLTGAIVRHTATEWIEINPTTRH